MTDSAVPPIPTRLVGRHEADLLARHSGCTPGYRPRRGRELQPPGPPDPAEHCFACHGPDARRGPWAGLGFDLLDTGGEPFEGFRFRTDANLKINFLWLLHYVTENAARQNRVPRPNSTNRVWFDDVVVAEEYIGPVQATGEAGSP